MHDPASFRRLWLPVLLTILAVGCGEGTGGDAAGEAVDAVPGEVVYLRSCYSCHASGAAGAPRTGDVQAWQARSERGWDALMATTLNGRRGMPARGLCRQCSDEDLALALGYMLQRSGGLPESTPADLAARLENNSARD